MSTTSLSQDQRCNARQRSEEKKGREINSLNRLAEFSGAIGSIYRGHFIIFLPRTGRHRYLHARGIQIHSAVSRIRFLGLSGAGRASKRNRTSTSGWRAQINGVFPTLTPVSDYTPLLVEDNRIPSNGNQVLSNLA